MKHYKVPRLVIFKDMLTRIILTMLVIFVCLTFVACSNIFSNNTITIVITILLLSSLGSMIWVPFFKLAYEVILYQEKIIFKAPFKKVEINFSEVIELRDIGYGKYIRVISDKNKITFLSMINDLNELIEKIVLNKPDIKVEVQKKGGLLGKPNTFSRKANVGCLIILIPSICFFVWVYYTNVKAMQQRAISALARDNLRKILTSCEEYWENNPTNDCSLPTSKKGRLDWGLNPDMVEISIINGQAESFKATAKHYESDKIFQIDHNGNTSIKN